MLNYLNWFPTGKVVFLAPTKPLVQQQYEACCIETPKSRDGVDVRACQRFIHRREGIVLTGE